MTIRGYDAISVAKELHLPLGKYSGESSRGFRLDLSVEEADELATIDENLIFLDLDISGLKMEELVALSVSLGGEPGQSFTGLRNKFDALGDDDRAEIFDAMAKRWSELKARSH
ncbi:MAG: hypothetical protein WAW37_07390 [Syntrophobacteraceae bacterium]